MMTQVFSFLATGINAVFSWFTSLTDAMPGIIGAFLAFFTMFVIYRALIKPLIGSAGISRHENRGSYSTYDSNGNRVDRYGNYV